MNSKLDQIPELIRAFQLSIFDFALKLKNDKGTLSAEDLEGIHYIIGMAQVNVTNLQKALDLGQSYYQDNVEKIDRLITEATAFADSLKEEGFGKSKFQMGQITYTPGALQVLAENYTLPEDLINRHAIGDFGDLAIEDIQRNFEAIQDGSRIFSAYVLSEGVKAWVITEAQDDEGVRRSTTILLPEEY